jgi:hypothetical protein
MSPILSRLLIVAFAITSLGAGSPAERYCASLGQGSNVARAESALEFYRNITTDPVLPTSSVCLADHIDEIHEKAKIYCAAQKDRGHDAIAEPLHDLEFELMIKNAECNIGISSEIAALLEPPIPCKNLEEVVALTFSFVEPLFEIADHSENDLWERYADCVSRGTKKMESEVDAYCSSRSHVDEAFATSLMERAYNECLPLTEELHPPSVEPEPTPE